MRSFCGHHLDCYKGVSLNVNPTKPLQGRPLGFLWTWLSNAHRFDTKEDQINYGNPRTNDSFEIDFTLDVRTVARADAYLAIAEQDDGVFPGGRSRVRRRPRRTAPDQLIVL